MRRGLAVLALSLVASSAHAADVKSACIASSDTGQDQRDHGKLLAARESFVACARDACPRVVRVECASWLKDVEGRIPSLVLSATDENGQDISDAVVTLDGAELETRLDGRRVQIDPGEHTVSFTRGDVRAEEHLVVQESDKARAVAVVLRHAQAADAARSVEKPSPLPPAPPPSRPIPTMAFVLGGVAVVGAASFAIFAGTAKHDDTELQASCAPFCPSSSVDPARRDLVIGNVSLGIGLAALAGAVIVVLLRPNEQPADSSLFSKQRNVEPPAALLRF